MPRKSRNPKSVSCLGSGFLRHSGFIDKNRHRIQCHLAAGNPGSIEFSNNLILNGDSPAQLSIDFRTGRRTAIHAGNSCAEQRAACIALNRIRTRGILEATQLASSGEPLSLDDRFAAIAGLSRDRDVPLISLDLLGIHHDDDGLRSSSLLTALPSGAEAIPYFDKDWGVVYKLFDLRVDGSLGKRIELVRKAEGDFDLIPCDATLKDTLEKLAVLNEAGAHPTEIVGLSDSGDYLIAKQPWAYPRGDFEEDRRVPWACSYLRVCCP